MSSSSLSPGPKFPTYSRSDFSRNKTSIPELSTSEKINEVLESAFDLSSVFTVKSYDELKQILNEHYFNSPTSNVEKTNIENNSLIEDELDTSLNNESSNTITIQQKPSETVNSIDEDFINDLLKQ